MNVQAALSRYAPENSRSEDHLNDPPPSLDNDAPIPKITVLAPLQVDTDSPVSLQGAPLTGATGPPLTGATGPPSLSSQEGDRSFTTKKPENDLLADRRKSRQERTDDIKKLVSNVAGATSVRKHLKEDIDMDLTVKFNKKEFFLSMIYETLPPVIFSPLVAFIIEGPRRAYHLVNHRLLLPIDKTYQRGNPAIMPVFWIVVIPILFMVNASACLFVYNRAELHSKIDTWEVFLGYLAFLCRNAVLSIKYAYYGDEELEGVRSAAPNWTDSHQARKLIGGGWRYPLEHEDLVEDELAEAQDLIDVNLGAPSFKVQDPKTATFLRKFDCHPDFRADNKHNKRDEVSAAFVVHQFVRTAFSDDIPFGFNAFIANWVPLLMAQLPNWVRFSKGQHAFGETHQEKFIHAGMFICRFIFFAQLFLFGYIATHDFNRRRKCMKFLGKMTSYPGLEVSSFLLPRGSKGEKKDKENAKKKEKEKEKMVKMGGGKIHMADVVEEDPEKGNAKKTDVTTCDDPEIENLRLYVDLRENGNAFAWVLLRRTVKAFGSGYFNRIQAYVGVLFIYSVIAMIALNVIFWSSMNHYVSTIYYIILMTFWIAVCVLTGISEATKLQELVTYHRMILKNEIFAIDQTLTDNKMALNEKMKSGREGMGSTGCTPGIRMSGPPAMTNLMSPYRKNTPKPSNFQELQETEEQLMAAKTILKSADDLIGYQEEIHMPVNVMGVHATNGVYNSTIGILLTFLVLAVEGYSSGGLAYESGWSTFAGVGGKQ